MSESTTSSDASTAVRQPSIRQPTTMRPTIRTDEANKLNTEGHDSNNIASPMSPRISSAQRHFRRRESLELNHYFSGPRDLSKHSKWPMFMRMHGSIAPKMILPLLIVGAWATAVTLVYQYVYDIGVNSVLLTITGFVISLGLSLRSSTAYERYAEGRKYWAMLVQASQTLGRVFWIHSTDPEDQDVRELMLKKLSAMNMVVAFSVALKHTLRFEPFTVYNDMQHMIGHLDTLAKEATQNSPPQIHKKKGVFKEVGEYLGVSFATSNPRKALKKSDQPLGNLPLEILNHLAITIDEMVRNGQLEIPGHQTLAYNNLGFLNDCLVGCERVLNTPLPLAYSIAISQITWVYIMLLPFQLVTPLKGWIAIPATVFAAYIILGLLLTGGEIENPFGEDVNDLPLEVYCEQIAADMDIIASYEKREPDAFMKHADNMPLYPVSTASMGAWMQRSEEHLRNVIKTKPKKTFEMRKTKVFGDSEKDASHMV